MKYCDSRIIYNLQLEWKWHIFLLRKQQVCDQTATIEVRNLKFVSRGNNRLSTWVPALMIKHLNKF